MISKYEGVNVLSNIYKINLCHLSCPSVYCHVNSVRELESERPLSIKI